MGNRKKNEELFSRHFRVGISFLVTNTKFSFITIIPLSPSEALPPPDPFELFLFYYYYFHLINIEPDPSSPVLVDRHQ